MDTRKIFRLAIFSSLVTASRYRSSTYSREPATDAHVAEDHRGFDETKERRSIASGGHQCIFAGQRRDCFPCLRFGHRRQRWYKLHRVPIWSTARRVNASDLDSGELFATHHSFRHAQTFGLEEVAALFSHLLDHVGHLHCLTYHRPTSDDIGCMMPTCPTLPKKIASVCGRWPPALRATMRDAIFRIPAKQAVCDDCVVAFWDNVWKWAQALRRFAKGRG